MRNIRPQPRLVPLLTLLLLPLLAANESLNAYIPATHKRLFESFNTLIFGEITGAKLAIRGALGVSGNAEIADFDIGGDGQCNREKRMITVKKSLTARMGSIHNGYTVVGKGSKIHHSVRMTCTNRVEAHDPHRNGDIDFEEMHTGVIREVSEMCVTEPTGAVETDNSTMKFDPGEKGYSCYTFFRITTNDLRLVNRWEYVGDDFYRNIVVVVSGLKAEFRDFQMIGFNPRRTLVVFCAVYGSFGLYNAKIQGSLLAPTASFTSLGTIVNGSIITGGMRGSFVTLNVPYVTC